MANKDKVTAWLDAETERGTKRITRLDMNCDDAPTIFVKNDRHRVCTMDFPDDQKDMKSPFQSKILKAFAAIVLEGLTPAQRRAVREAVPELLINDDPRF